MRFLILCIFFNLSCATKSGTLNLEKEGRVTRLDENGWWQGKWNEL